MIGHIEQIQENRNQGFGGIRNPDASAPMTDVTAAADRFLEEQLFEEDLRAMLTIMRPNRRERLMGWSQYLTGGCISVRPSRGTQPGANAGRHASCPAS